MTTLDLALHYATDLGWPVFQLAPRTKIPLKGSSGFHGATTDRLEICAWWKVRPQCGIGIACTRVVVLDIDTKDGKGGMESLAALEAEHGPMPETWRATTPSGGLHYYFAARPRREVRRTVAVLPGIDLCGVGGYVVAPPTLTERNDATRTHAGTYRWLADDDPPLAVVPTWICELAKPVAEPTPSAPFSGRWGSASGLDRRIAAAVRYADKCEPSVSGSGGHDRAWMLARALVHKFELPESVALDVLRHFNARCQPPWSERELAHKIRSARTVRVRPETARVVRRAS